MASGLGQTGRALRVLVTGASGFVGTALVPQLLADGHQVTAIVRVPARAASQPWFQHVRCIAADLADTDAALLEAIGAQDALVHLAWSGLPNYHQLFHLEHNLPAAWRFIQALVRGGLQQVLVAGTCFEYGAQSGCLAEHLPALPNNAYAVAKDSLRRHLQCLQKLQPFTLQWARLFYMHGPGQHPGSLLAQLDAAIDRGDERFDMSGGEQLRDYLPVAEVARRLAGLLLHPDCNGVVNVCSGQPVSVRSLVEQHLARRGARMALNLGHHPYPAHEPMAFWGHAQRLAALGY